MQTTTHLAIAALALAASGAQAADAVIASPRTRPMNHPIFSLLLAFWLRRWSERRQRSRT